MAFIADPEALLELMSQRDRDPEGYVAWAASVASDLLEELGCSSVVMVLVGTSQATLASAHTDDERLRAVYEAEHQVGILKRQMIGGQT